MDDAETLVAQVIGAAGGWIVGRIRLQKEIYLLDQLGIGSGFSYAYHHYGPYSADLADAIDGAKAFSFIAETRQSRLHDGVPFSLFTLGAKAPVADKGKVGGMKRGAGRRALSRMQARSSTVLELAATIHWLRGAERVEDWRSELDRRKGAKTAFGRADQAEELLKELALA